MFIDEITCIGRNEILKNCRFHHGRYIGSVQSMYWSFCGGKIGKRQASRRNSRCQKTHCAMARPAGSRRIRQIPAEPKEVIIECWSAYRQLNLFPSPFLLNGWAYGLVINTIKESVILQSSLLIQVERSTSTSGHSCHLKPLRHGLKKNLRPQDKAPGLQGFHYTYILVNQLILLSFFPFVGVFVFYAEWQQACTVYAAYHWQK